MAVTPIQPDEEFTLAMQDDTIAKGRSRTRLGGEAENMGRPSLDPGGIETVRAS